MALAENGTALKVVLEPGLARNPTVTQGATAVQDRPFSFGFFPEGTPTRCDNHIIRNLSSMKGQYADAGAFQELLAQADAVHYEVYEIRRPEASGELLQGVSVVHPGKVGGEYFMTKGHFHSVLETAEVYYCLRGQGMMVMETPEGEWCRRGAATGPVLVRSPALGASIGQHRAPAKTSSPSSSTRGIRGTTTAQSSGKASASSSSSTTAARRSWITRAGDRHPAVPHDRRGHEAAGIRDPDQECRRSTSSASPRGKSSIMKVFPLWAKELGHGDVVIEGMDLKLHDTVRRIPAGRRPDQVRPTLAGRARYHAQDRPARGRARHVRLSRSVRSALRRDFQHLQARWRNSRAMPRTRLPPG